MKSKFNFVILFLSYTLLFFILSRASIYGVIFPFAFSMFFALAWVNQKVWLLIPSYIIGAIANNYHFEGIISCLVTIFMLALPYYIHLVAKKPMKKWELFIYAGLSQVAYLIFNILGGENPIYYIGTILLGLLFLFISISIFEPLIIRGMRYKLTTSELVCGAIVLMGISDGLSTCDIYGFSLLKLVVSFLILSISYTSNISYTILFSSIMGLGTLLRTNNPIFIAPFMIWTLAIIIFRMRNRIFPAIAMIASEMLIVYYFELYYSNSVITFIPVIVSALIFIIIPTKIYDEISVLLSNNNERLAMKNIVNKNREFLYRRLNNLSEVFYDMNQVFRKLIKRNMNEEEVKDMLYEEIKASVCNGCPEQKHCHRTFNDDTKRIFKELITIAFERGRITLLDLPSYLSSRCGKANYLISEINTLTKQYKSYSQLVGNVDTSKLLISDQLSGISGIMKSLASEVDSNISFDNVRENKLIEELASNNIICADAVVYEQDARTTMTSVIVREEDVNKLKLQQVVSKICGNKMTIFETYPSVKAGLINVNLKTAPMYDCLFGLASQPKSGNNVSGDCHSIERLDGEKFMFAICDGMGSGKEAGEKSETAINLVEGFYKAGFENEIILSSVNKLLNLESDDIFSTIDICVIDLKNGIADFVKMGSASSFIRSQDECKIIECEALPIGVLQDISPMTKKIVLKDKDFIILCSDGITDTFGSDQEMKDFILTIKTANPQEFADKILEKALANNNGYAVDDMTCLVVKIF